MHCGKEIFVVNGGSIGMALKSPMLYTPVFAFSWRKLENEVVRYPHSLLISALFD